MVHHHSYAFRECVLMQLNRSPNRLDAHAQWDDKYNILFHPLGKRNKSGCPAIDNHDRSRPGSDGRPPASISGESDVSMHVACATRHAIPLCHN
jgi:hypothetical protein